jgi:preprotein translocase subunit SecA
LTDGSYIRNNLVEIKTGEGKSVVLAVVSIIFALNGFKVNCACSTSYLSARDYESFLPLFRVLNLLNYITYGTLNKLAE